MAESGLSSPAALGRQRSFPSITDSWPWPAAPPRRESASWRGNVLTLSATSGRWAP